MILMTKDYCTKEYKGDVPWGTISAIVAALIYFVSPFDVVPDFMAGIGYVDDAAVIKLCMDLTKEDLNRYRIWKKSS
ncbi:MAG: DUF1232 domain-containing protein [Desulfobulbaceae bacterium]|nr:DUF1232 domain-containing protein [Desulfobulbaceae bacterium]